MLCKFPKVLAKLRRQKGISQKKAAEELGISPALLSHYENGIRECGLDFLLRLSEYYSVSCDYLLGKSTIKNIITKKIQNLPKKPVSKITNPPITQIQLAKRWVFVQFSSLFNVHGILMPMV